MATTELHANTDRYVLCPLRGEISLEWCEGCPYRVRVEERGDRAVVVCHPNTGSIHDLWFDPHAHHGSSSLRDVPDIWR